MWHVTGAVTSSASSWESSDSEWEPWIQEQLTHSGYFSQGLTLTIFEACHIHLSQGTWFIPDFYNCSAELQGGQTFRLCSGLGPASSELKGLLRIRHFWDQSGDLQRILSEHKALSIKKKKGGGAQAKSQPFRILMHCDTDKCFELEVTGKVFKNQNETHQAPLLWYAQWLYFSQ